jgi:prepilin-type processing-associated H-X9-DG protein
MPGEGKSYIVFSTHRVKYPAALMMMAEAHGDGWAAPIGKFSGISVNKGESIYHTYKKQYPGWVPSHPTNFGLTGLHGGRNNILFFDQHVGAEEWWNIVYNEWQTVRE